MDEKDVEQLQNERDEYLEGWKRAKADLVNYKKEEAERMARIAEYAEHEFLKKVFPILDNIERAMQLIPEKEKKNQVYKGFVQIAFQWKNFLVHNGVEEIETAGKPFNPEFHEAVGEEEGKDSGIVAEVVEKGYRINGKLLRPAKVKVTK
jgi:molecular chaperone GrpE